MYYYNYLLMYVICHMLAYHKDIKHN